MLAWVAGIVLLIFAIVCLVRWFQSVRRIMQERAKTIDSAFAQWEAYCQTVDWTNPSPDAAGILALCENIYLQAVDIHNRMIRKMWICVPAHLMGYRRISKEEAALRIHKNGS